MGIQQQRLLRRHLQELRRQDSEANRHPRQLQQGTGSSKSSSGAGGSVGPNELRIGPVFQLSGIGGNEARRIEKQLVPAAIKVLQKYLQVRRRARLHASAGGGGGGEGFRYSLWCLQPLERCRKGR
jgi:hypothetical protein